MIKVKKIFFMVALVAMALTCSYAQETSKQTSPNQLINYYYDIKNAMVESNAGKVSASAKAFLESAKTVNSKVVSDDSLKALVEDATKIAESKDLEKQRDYFAGFSSKMLAVAKSIKAGNQTIYQQYCPMKNAYWLSNEKTIKNPYYGSSMLTCGKVNGML